MVAVVVSNSAIVLIRRDVGYRLLTPLMSIVYTVMLIGGYCELSVPGVTALDGFCLMVFAFGSACAASMHRWRQRPGTHGASTHIHTRSRGRSAHLLGGMFRSMTGGEAFCQRFLEPITLFCIGLVCIHIGLQYCGVWFALCGACLRVVEDIVERTEQETLADLRDSRSATRALSAKDAEPPSKVEQEQKKASGPQTIKPAALSPELKRLTKNKWFRN